VPVVADVRVGERDDLARVRGIGEDLLVARHRGVEDDLAAGAAVGANATSAKDAPVGEDQDGGSLLRQDLLRKSSNDAKSAGAKKRESAVELVRLFPSCINPKL
jgi:hypothetical protein